MGRLAAGSILRLSGMILPGALLDHGAPRTARLAGPIAVFNGEFSRDSEGKVGFAYRQPTGTGCWKARFLCNCGRSPKRTGLPAAEISKESIDLSSPRAVPFPAFFLGMCATRHRERA